MKTQCYLCGGSIDFPDELKNEIIPCPHCGKSIKLLGPKRKGFASLNKRQKFLSFAALSVLIFGLFQAPWEISYVERGFHEDVRHSEIELAPIFSPPEGSFNSSSRMVSGRRLIWSAVVGSWLSVGVIYTGLFALSSVKFNIRKETMLMVGVALAIVLVLLAIVVWFANKPAP
jgi:hypothetical protein